MENPDWQNGRRRAKEAGIAPDGRYQSRRTAATIRDRLCLGRHSVVINKSPKP